MSLQEKICVVTGAAGVLCSALVEALLEEGAKVALLGRTESKLIDLKNRLAEKGYEQTLVVAADVLDRKSLEDAKAKINKTWGKVYLLVTPIGN